MVTAIGFQSLLGICLDFNANALSAGATTAMFQSLLGICLDFNTAGGDCYFVLG